MQVLFVIEPVCSSLIFPCYALPLLAMTLTPHQDPAGYKTFLDDIAWSLKTKMYLSYWEFRVSIKKPEKEKTCVLPGSTIYFGLQRKQVDRSMYQVFCETRMVILYINLVLSVLLVRVPNYLLDPWPFFELSYCGPNPLGGCHHIRL